MQRNISHGWRHRLKHDGGEDMPPTGEEARSQRRSTSMPIVWLGLALALMAAFAAVLAVHFGVTPRAAHTPDLPQSPIAPPTKVR